MELAIVLVLVVASESLCEGVKLMQLPFHGVNGHRGKPRPSQSFHCTAESGTKQQSSSSAPAPIVCPLNMTTGNCTDMCQASCEGIERCGTLECNVHPGCVCHPWLYIKDGDCVPVEDCGCFVEGVVIAEGETLVTEDCNQNCTCSNQEVKCTSCDENCSSSCSQQSFPLENDDGRGNFLDCYDAFKANFTEDGVYYILPTNWTGPAFPVYCDMTTNGSGWTVFQRRKVNTFRTSYSFHRSWNSYKNGFFVSRENYWLGNEKVFHLTDQKNYRLRVEIVTADGGHLVQEYSLFKLANESKLYSIIALGESSGNAGDGMRCSEGQPFSTRDRDNDGKKYFNCAKIHGGWWYSAHTCQSCLCRSPDYQEPCTSSNINSGYWNIWHFSCEIIWNGYRFFVESTEMKIRPSE